MIDNTVHCQPKDSNVEMLILSNDVHCWRVFLQLSFHYDQKIVVTDCIRVLEKSRKFANFECKLLISFISFWIKKKNR